jgi:hypothetical protein
MYNSSPQKNRMEETVSLSVYDRRKGLERRKEPACGFTQISTVGWICRREQFRRKDDPKVFIPTAGVAGRQS